MRLGTKGTKWAESANSSRSWWDEKDESPIGLVLSSLTLRPRFGMTGGGHHPHA